MKKALAGIFYNIECVHGAGPVMGVFFGTFVLKVIDGVILACIVPLLYKLTPKKVRPEKL